MTLQVPTDPASAGASGNAEAPSPEALAHPIESTKAWWRQLTGYHWFVFLVASAAWFFDCLDQRIFSLARIPALNSLNAISANPATDQGVQNFGKVVTASFLIGWGVGGLIFGALGDKFGRARMLTITILIYSAFTGLTFFSQTWFDFTLFRFMTGLGVGGVFGLAVALIAETVPSGARAQSLGMLQILSTIGNITAGFVQKGSDTLELSGTITAGTGWRWMFLVGAIPALMVILTGRWLREPEPWLKLKREGKLPKGSIFKPYEKLFKETRWRKNLIVGALIASTGVVGLWAIGEYAVDLQRQMLRNHFAPEIPRQIAAPATVLASVPDQASTPLTGPVRTQEQVAAEQAKLDKARNLELDKKGKPVVFLAYILNMLGAATGMWLFAKLANIAGRRVAFLCGFSAALVVTVFVYWRMATPQDAYWMMFLMGAAQLSVFAGFAIYLPELFPSSLRSTGTSFCYNLGRFAAAGGSLISAYLSEALRSVVAPGDATSTLPFRYSAIIMCSFFLIGLLTLPFAPETKGKPLPE